MRTNQELTAVVSLPALSPAVFEVRRHNAPAENDAATGSTIGYILNAAAVDACSRIIREATREAISTAGSSRRDRAAAIFGWVKSHVRFRNDEYFLENVLGLEDELDLLIRPAALLSLNDPEEDCDGFTMLTMAMLLAASIPCAPVTIKADSRRPWRWSHIFCVAYLENGEGFPLDASRGPAAGWCPPEYFDMHIWEELQPAPRSLMQGYGLGDDGDPYGGETVTSGSPITVDSTGGSDWTSILAPLIKGGLQIAQQVTLPAGSYVQTAGGVTTIARGVPGAVPGQFPGIGLNLGTSGSLTGPLLIGGALLLAVLAFGGRR
jgi:hypothetical protein